MEENKGNEIPNFIASLVQQNYDNYAASCQSLIDSYRKGEARQKATVDLIRQEMTDLLFKPWSPSASAITKALHPEERRINALAEEYLEGSRN